MARRYRASLIIDDGLRIRELLTENVRPMSNGNQNWWIDESVKRWLNICLVRQVSLMSYQDAMFVIRSIRSMIIGVGLSL